MIMISSPLLSSPLLSSPLLSSPLLSPHLLSSPLLSSPLLSSPLLSSPLLSSPLLSSPPISSPLLSSPLLSSPLLSSPLLSSPLLSSPLLSSPLTVISEAWYLRMYRSTALSNTSWILLESSIRCWEELERNERVRRNSSVDSLPPIVLRALTRAWICSGQWDGLCGGGYDGVEELRSGGRGRWDGARKKCKHCRRL